MHMGHLDNARADEAARYFQHESCSNFNLSSQELYVQAFLFKIREDGRRTHGRLDLPF